LINLGFTTEGRLAAVLIIPSSWGSQRASSYKPSMSFLAPLPWTEEEEQAPTSTTRQQNINKFSGTVAGEEEDFCKGSLSRTIFYFVFILLYFIFACIVLSKIKKIVSFILSFIYLLLDLLEWVLLKTPSCVTLLAPKTVILFALLLHHLLLRQIFMRSNLLY
jgi:hypothetical protein